jgi:hypothetical protein
MTWPIAFNPSSSLIASSFLSLEEAGNPESAKDSVRYHPRRRCFQFNNVLIGIVALSAFECAQIVVRLGWLDASKRQFLRRTSCMVPPLGDHGIR